MGLVFNYEKNNSFIQKFTLDGGFLKEWEVIPDEDEKTIDLSSSVAVDDFDCVYVADSAHHRIQKFSSDGDLLDMWKGMGINDGEFLMPGGIAVDELGYVYVKDSGGTSLFTNNQRIQKFTADGAFITKWYFSGLDDPFSVKLAVDKDGYVYVTQGGSDRILKFGKSSATTTIPESSTTTTNPDSVTTSTTTTICPSQEIYGVWSGEVELLRYFRDNVLSQTPEGQELIRLYYELSPVIVKTMEADEEFKQQVKEVIDGMVGVIKIGVE